MSNASLIDKQQLRTSFSVAAKTYDRAAVLQREICDRLVERLEYINIKPARILDVGTGTGYATAALHKLFPRAEIIAMDIAYPMLAFSRKRHGFWSRIKNKIKLVNADIEDIPLVAQSVDLVFSNLTLQWVNRLDHVFAEFLRILRPDGMLLFSTFGPDTLKELRSSWESVDQYSHVNQFLDMHDIGDALLRNRLAEPVMDTEYLTLTYPDVYGLMRDLKDIGAHNITSNRARGLMGKEKFRSFRNSYEQFRVDNVLPATYEVVYGHAWKGAVNPSGTHNVEIAVEDIILKK